MHRMLFHKSDTFNEMTKLIGCRLLISTKKGVSATQVIIMSWWLTGERSVTYIVVAIVFSKCISINTKPTKASGGNFTPTVEMSIFMLKH